MQHDTRGPVATRAWNALALTAGCIAALTAAAPAAVASEPYPTRPITLTIPYPPGGSADLLARPLAAELQKELGQTVVIDYKPGAGGTIATGQLARAKPDGYSLLMVLAAHSINPSLYPDLPYNTAKDFTPVSLVANLPMLAVAPKDAAFNSMKELVAYAKQNPGKVSYASAGNGNTSHLAVEQFKRATGTDILHVHYKGSGPAVVAMLRNEVDLMFDSISTSLPQVKAGKLKALAVTGDQRAAVLPDVPTVRETGIADYTVNGWYGIIAPAGTPPDIVDSLSQKIAAVVKQPAFQKQLSDNGYTLEGTTPAAFGTHIERETTRWAKVVKDAGVKMQ